ncbi:kinase-like domain-containing protein [Pyrenochaeta sp. MPI-SDFR-AT-0127]|nr:kinase-like domain-containing protein [Pyrenochaeta sp. MPI-SDFR-AT-0127]
MRQHIKRFHPKDTYINLSKCKIPNIRATFPAVCHICLHYRNRDWKDRCRHIIPHFKGRKDTLSAVKQDSVERREHFACDYDDDEVDDDDKDGSEDEDGSDNEADMNGANDSDDEDGGPQDNNADPVNKDNDDNAPDPSNESPPDDHYDSASGIQNDDSQRNPDNDVDNFSGICHWDSSAFRGFPSSISHNHIARDTKKDSDTPPLRRMTIEWLEKVNQKGGTASVFKVALSADLNNGDYGKRMMYAVKQYPSKYRALYEQEIEVFRKLHKQGHNLANIITCYGTFHFRNSSGQITHNILLEYGDCDLREYWADTPRPYTAEEITAFWRRLFDVLLPLSRIHEGYKLDADHSVRGIHGDIKADNIIIVDGTFKLADLGFTSFLAIRNGTQHPASTRRGGTAIYSKYPSPSTHTALLTKYRCTRNI